MSEKSLGRPKLENPRSNRITIRLDSHEKKVLDDYCKKNNCTYSEAVRKLLNDQK